MPKPADKISIDWNSAECAEALAAYVKGKQDAKQLTNAEMATLVKCGEKTVERILKGTKVRRDTRRKVLKWLDGKPDDETDDFLEPFISFYAEHYGLDPVIEQPDHETSDGTSVFSEIDTDEEADRNGSGLASNAHSIEFRPKLINKIFIDLPRGQNSLLLFGLLGTVLGVTAIFAFVFLLNDDASSPQDESYSLLSTHYEVEFISFTDFMWIEELGQDPNTAGYEISTKPQPFSSLTTWPLVESPVVITSILWDRSLNTTLHQFEFEGTLTEVPPQYDDDYLTFPNMAFESVLCVSFFHEGINRWTKHFHVARPDDERMYFLTKQDRTANVEMVTVYEPDPSHSRTELRCPLDPREDELYRTFSANDDEIPYTTPSGRIKQPRSLEDLGWSATQIEDDQQFCLKLVEDHETYYPYRDGYNIVLTDDSGGWVDFSRACFWSEDVLIIEFFPLNPSYPPLEAFAIEGLREKVTGR